MSQTIELPDTLVNQLVILAAHLDTDATTLLLSFIAAGMVAILERDPVLQLMVGYAGGLSWDELTDMAQLTVKA